MKIETLPLSSTPSASIPTASRRRWRKPAIALAVIALAGGGWYALQGKSAPPPAAAAAKKADKPTVFELAQNDVVTVESRELALRLPLSGSLAPLAQATVKSKVSGVVLETGVREGMKVAAGQVIARLDDADARARVAQQAALLKEASARLAMATKNEANSQALLKQNYISQNSFDTTRNSVELAQAAVDAARAQLDLARIALNDTLIRAPLSGVVSKRYVQAGEKLSPDSPVMAIVDLQHLTLDAQVPASDIPRVQVGQDVRFKVDGFNGRDFQGKVARINPATEAGSRSMLVYISVANDDSSLRAGMFAKGSITTDKSDARPIVPLAALRKDGTRDVVYRVDSGKVVAQPVRLGMKSEDEGLAEVTEGVQAGAVLLAVPLDGVKPGSAVKLNKPAAPAQSQVTLAKKD
ncbi:efflux RND transporter periplasmic adaptor subunit [Massilia sp. Mn16-1_5]|uniref:efflux RND transporter periplasmic adaptor subunit n=1 Tax=Massilia sp. Mn16-1_5 TaxID=2079199 RepID=UPI00109E536F|nr:efflux RND transporter periplasmic adaptor subunit [Massilia sp. Mn16-1_5]THC42222.1 efflux RND transporter periplasmic adaptor subunit [Massilia sp. Mn16-1_5]